MAKKFLTDIKIAAGVYDSSGDIGNSGQVLSSTGSGVNWINTTTSASIIYQDGFTGDGSTTAFTLANSLDNENKTQVYIEGVYQHKDNYSLNGATLTFSSAPPNTSDIEVISFGSVTAADDILYDDDFTSAGLMTTDGSGVYSITTNNSSNWNTAYTHSQAAHAPANAEQNVQSDWTATSGDSFIQNKPTIPSGNQIIDWTADQGSTEIHSGNYINTTYTVGDGGLTQNNFTNALKTKLDGIETSADVTDTTNVTAAGALMDSELTDLAGVKAVTISDLATETYVDTAVSDLVDSSPATLDTLNELAAALGDDPNFATTTATSIGLKAPLASPSFTGNATFSGTITASGYNDSNWNTAYGWGDHAGAGYLTSSSTQSKYVRSDANDTISGVYTLTNSTTAATIQITGHAGASNYNYFLSANNDGGTKAVHFVNGSTRTSDGGANAYTIRNDGGKLILGSASHETNITGSSLTVTPNATFAGDVQIDKSLSVGKVGGASGIGNLTLFSRYSVAAPYISFKTDHPSESTVWETGRIDSTDSGNFNGKMIFKVATGSGSAAGGASMGTVLTLDDDSSATFAGTITASNLSGTNTGDQTLPTASSLGAVTLNGNQTISGIKTFNGTNVTLDTPVNSWKYVRLQSSGTVKWDIATNESNDSSSLQFRPAGGSTNRVTISQAGAITAPSVSSAIFYDSGNTNQFIDPGGSTSRMLGFLKIGNSSTYNTDDGNWGTRLQVASTIHARIDVAQDANAMRSTWYCHTGHTGSYFGTTTGHHQHIMSHNAVRQTLFSGYSQEAASYRAPIFYDSNDTTYYLDPALTGKSLKIAGGISTNVANGDVIIKHTVSEANSWLFQENAPNWGLFWNNEPNNGVAFGSYTTVGAEFLGFRQSSATNMINPSAWTGINSTAHAAWMFSNYSGDFWTAGSQYSAVGMRAPIFYDANNTSYYVDPASTSILNRVEINDDLDVRSQIGTWITSDIMGDAIGWNSSFGVYIGSNVGGTHYLRGNGTFTTGGNTYNLWHTGNDTGLLVKGTAIFANAVVDDTSGPLNFNRSTGWDEYIIKHGTGKGMFGKKGIGWHMDSANSFHILSSNWTANFGVEHGGSCRAAGDLRAPIFYDLGNTGYYADPAGASHLNAVQITSPSGSVGTGLKIYSTSQHQYPQIHSNAAREAMWNYKNTAAEWYVGIRTSGQLVGSSGFHFYNTTSGQTVGGWDINGHSYSIASSRAPIFYDSNNTGYYTDPASISILNGLQFGFTQHGSANNIRMGNQTTMNAISSGTNNAAFGVEALGGCSTGSRNFAYGYAALYSLSSGGSNIAMGDATGYNVTSGSNNLLFGQNAGRTGYQSPYQSIAGVTSGSNQIHMGNESHSTARIQISWTVNSDARDKTDVTPINVGLDFVKDLNPVTFRWDKRSDYEDRTPTGENKLEELTLGFLAQEVEEVEKSYGYDVANKTNLVVDRDVEQDHFGITYEKMIPILTKAIQELEARVKELENN